VRREVFFAIVVTGACGGGGGGGAPDAPSPDAYVAPPFTLGVSTLAGFSDYGLIDGDRSTAEFHNPVNVAVGPDGMIYIADFDNSAIRRSDPAGNVTTVYKDPAHFVRPFGLAFASDGKLYVGTDNDDAGAHNDMSGTVWKLDVTAGTASVVAKNIGRARGLAFLPDGRLVVTDFLHDTVSTLDTTTGAITLLAGAAGAPGFMDGAAAIARFNGPYGVAVIGGASAPMIVVADFTNQRIRAIGLDGATSTIAGTGATGYMDGDPLTVAKFDHPEGLTADAAGTLYVTDLDNYRVRRMTTGATPTVDTIAGNGTGGYKDADDRLAAELYGLEGLSVSSDGKSLYVADGSRGDDTEPYHRVRVVTISQ
jgi:DNA-binding beta-propeller fold protein YncE